MTFIDGTGAAPMKDAVMLVADGRVAAIGAIGALDVPSDARMIDLTGKTVMPALIDAHSHLGIIAGNTINTDHYTPERVNGQLRTFAAYGIRAVQILGTDQDHIFDVKRAQGDAPVDQAKVFSAYRGFGITGGQPPMSLGKFVYRPASADEARKQFAEFASKGPDVVKIWVDSNFGRWPTTSKEVVGAIVDEAHKRGLRVATHVFFRDDVKWLIPAGVDMIGHSVRDKEIDDELIAIMKEHGTIYIPTLTIDEARYIMADRPAYMSDPFFVKAVPPDTLAWLKTDAYRDAINKNADTALWRAAALMSKKNAGIAHRAGIPVAMGTDSGGAPERIIGYDSHKELGLLVDQGFTPLQAINAATVVSARAIGARARDLGSLEPGKRANFLVLDADPTRDIKNTQKLSQVWYGGEQGPNWQSTALHEHDRNIAFVPTEELFDPSKGHARSACC
jgi:imidazolonepropionase-like amidohydrolase